MNVQRVGIIGLGQLGTPLARCLSQAGWELTAYDVRKEAVDALVDQEVVESAASPEEVAERTETVLIVVFDASQVREVCFGDRGLVRGQSVQRVVCVSTIGPAAVRTLDRDLRDAGLRLIDSPVTGGPARAEQGDLTVITAGADDDLSLVRPLLECVAGHLFEVGADPGDAQTVKMLNQYLLSTALTACAETLYVAEQAGLKLEQVQEVLSTGLGSNWVLQNWVPDVLRGGEKVPSNLHPVLQKDLAALQASINTTGTPLFLAGVLTELMRLAAVEAPAAGNYVDWLRRMFRLADS